jgi:hypothetical protein
MNERTMLTATSVISVLLLALHFADDIARGISRPGVENLFAVVILLVWLCGATLLVQRRSGLIISLLGGLFAAAMPVLHMQGTRFPTVAASSGGVLFVWILLVLGTLGVFTMILAVRLMRSTKPW